MTLTNVLYLAIGNWSSSPLISVDLVKNAWNTVKCKQVGKYDSIHFVPSTNELFIDTTSQTRDCKLFYQHATDQLFNIRHPELG